MLQSTIQTDRKYISLISGQLQRFTKKDDTLYTFRCPFCGDSKKNKYKTRGYFYVHKGRLNYKCHNCNIGMTFSNFLKSQSPALFKQYYIDLLKDQGRYREFKKSEDYLLDETPPPEPEPLPVKEIQLQSLADLDYSHFMCQYAVKRKIPKVFWSEIYYAPSFTKFVEELLPEQFGESKHNLKRAGVEPRLVLPWYDREKKLIGICARDMRETSTAKYITAKIHESVPKIFGLHRLDFTKRIYVLEGPIDSYFIENSCALMDSNLWRINELLAEYDSISKTIIPDNQPGNKEVVRMIQKTIDAGYDVFIWPRDIQEKDINDLVISGWSVSEIQHLIDTHTYSGLKARAVFSFWQKIN